MLAGEGILYAGQQSKQKGQITSDHDNVQMKLKNSKATGN